MGEEPPAFDILYWNADTTNLPAALHSDLLRLIETGGITAESGPTIGGHTLTLKHITCDTYLMGGETDHITPWDGCYLTRGGLGGASDLRAQPIRPRPVADQSAGQPEGAVPDK